MQWGETFQLPLDDAQQILDLDEEKMRFVKKASRFVEIGSCAPPTSCEPPRRRRAAPRTSLRCADAPQLADLERLGSATDSAPPPRRAFRVAQRGLAVVCARAHRPLRFCTDGAVQGLSTATPRSAAGRPGISILSATPCMSRELSLMGSASPPLRRRRGSTEFRW
jgi:hypothetical protein